MWECLFLFVVVVVIALAMGLPGLIHDLNRLDSDEARDWMCFFGFHDWKAWSKPTEFTYYRPLGGFTTHVQNKQCVHCNQFRTRRF